MPKILIIDSVENYCTEMLNMIGQLGHSVKCVQTFRDGLLEVFSSPYDVVFLNTKMSDGDGIEAIPEILDTHSSPEIIAITDTGDPDEAEMAIKRGAWDYLERPAKPSGMILPLVRALQYRAKKMPRSAASELKDETFQDIVAKSPQMKICLEVVTQAAKSDANVLINGDTGTGKELFSWAIHNNSSRANRNFVVVDCAALPETLVESTLFGHVKGAFTGADKTREGLIKQAHGGTLFLDEIGELSLSVQKSFLRVLQERHFRPVGGKREIKSDFRIIAASNRNLDETVQRGTFRKDLLFRIRAFNIDLPPLREHPEDIKDLAMFHMKRLCEFYGTKRKKFSPEFFEVLESYSWPGNVRELFNALERALSSAQHEPVIFPKHLPINIRIQIARSKANSEVITEDTFGERIASNHIPKLKERRATAISMAEKDYLQELISLTGGNIKESCRLSGLSRSRLYYLLKKYSISEV